MEATLTYTPALLSADSTPPAQGGWPAGVVPLGGEYCAARPGDFAQAVEIAERRARQSGYPAWAVGERRRHLRDRVPPGEEPYTGPWLRWHVGIVGDAGVRLTVAGGLRAGGEPRMRLRGPDDSWDAVATRITAEKAAWVDATTPPDLVAMIRLAGLEWEGAL